MKQILLNIFILFCAVTSFGQQMLKEQVNLFTAKTGAFSRPNNATGSVGLLKLSNGKAMRMSGTGPEEKGMIFLHQNLHLMGIKPGKDSYLLKESKKDNYGLEHIVMQQYFQGIRVYDGTLKFHFNKNNDLSSLSGNVISVDELNTVASVLEEDAAEEAVRIVTKQKPEHLVYEVEVRNDKNFREFVFIDAHTKAVAEQSDSISYIHRKLYEEEFHDERLVWEANIM